MVPNMTTVPLPPPVSERNLPTAAAATSAACARRAITVLLSLLLAAQLSLTSTANAADETTAAQPQPPHSTYMGGKVPNPGTNLWNEVRQRTAPVIGSTQVQGTDSGVLIDTTGDRWREIRRDRLIPWSAWGMLAVLAAIALFYFIAGPLKHPPAKPSDGPKLQRFEEFDRIIHWFMALTFIFLAVTGLLLLLGRFALIPWLGHSAFAAIASASKEGHNLFGPIFVVALLLFFIRFVSKNWYARGDINWLLKGGGMLGGKDGSHEHPSAGFFNAGEKLLFWAVVAFGTALSVSGLILVFQQFGQGRNLMQDMMLLHAIAAVVIIATVFGHIYLATIGVPGTAASMNDGKVDQAWARLHHDRWYAECEQQGLTKAKPDPMAAAAPPPMPPADQAAKTPHR